ncbi:outer membrane protein [Cucumibacter marinus]|uniref:outer membrane protein n=1 Tax=Cucumibacter marinus TaxID=1121252 RepID=UPI0004103BAB|nr:outer membrane beta-barrel protein [Cucumibacter marinus]
MRLTKTALLAGFALVASAGAASAADLYSTPDPAPAPVYNEPVSNWDGFYAGVLGTGIFTSPDNLFGGGLVAGFNAELDYLVLGAEMNIQGLRDSGTNNWETQGQVLGRAGALVTDDVLVYGAGGYGVNLSGTSESFGLLGGGMEVKFSEDLSFRGQYLYGNELSGGQDQHQVTMGAIWHF